uniref:Uncharacterized protein n=1 Tax=Panagrolaimus superbus TaxID=310955 RepID=A0A914Y3M1_9BILA
MRMLNNASKACIAAFKRNKMDSQEIIGAKSTSSALMHHFLLKYKLLKLLETGSEEQKGILLAALERTKVSMEIWSRLALDESLFKQRFEFKDVKVLQKYYN